MGDVSKGFLLIASLSSAYYQAAIKCAISIRDYYPDARITLYTHEDFIKESDRSLFENVILGIPVHSRAKLWCLDKTPYDITMYLDCDTEIQHEDINLIFDQIGDHDILITRIREYAGKGTYINDNERMEYHCGAFLYRKNEKTIPFMKKWWEEYVYQIMQKPWPWKEYSERMRPWDQFAFWRLLKEDKSGIKIGVFPDDARWNFVYTYNDDEAKDEIVVYHYTIPSEIVHANSIKNPSGSPTDIR